MKKIVCVFVAGIFAFSTAHASRRSRAEAQGRADGAVLAEKISDENQSGQNVQNTQASSLEQSSRDTTKNSQKGQGVATIMGAGFAGMGVMYGTRCGSQDYYSCAMAAVMVGMATMSFKSARSFNGPINTGWENTCQFSSLGCSGTPPNPFIDPNDPKIANSQQNISSAQKTIKKAGFQVDPNTGKVKDPSGKELDPSNPSSMADALGANGAKALSDAISQAEKEALAKVEQAKSKYNAAMGLDGSGGGGSNIAGGDGYDVDDPNGAGKGLGFGARERNPAQAKGLSKNFNGDPIGVASDSIFEMMRRRYQLKTTQKTFFGKEDAAN